VPQVVSPAYLDTLCKAREYEGLNWISAALCGSPSFDEMHATYGLPKPLFLLVESLAWFAQGVRSGARTYFEATPLERQQAMLEMLKREDFPADFAERYAFGASNWQDSKHLASLDTWLDRNDETNNQILWRLVERNRALIVASTRY